ncbi:hypothetical protein CspHIS471_0600040 [Cutaneotrichosporon sp. HIS471]|nr:hypothetical protein CspHIS471_0600040 [Cutaneotrichosporon sp. HIS471]
MPSLKTLYFGRSRGQSVRSTSTGDRPAGGRGPGDQAAIEVLPQPSLLFPYVALDLQILERLERLVKTMGNGDDHRSLEG